MRKNVFLLMVALVLFAAYAVPTVSAETIGSTENVELFKIDILDDTHTDASYVEDGFIGWAPYTTSSTPAPSTSTTVTTDDGDITVTFQPLHMQQDRYRTMPAGTPGIKMYQDSFFSRSNNDALTAEKLLDITISGLEAGQSYLVALYAYDYADWNGLMSTDWMANGEEAFTASWYAEDDGGEAIDLPTSLDTFKHTVVVEADSNGEILMTSTAGEEHTRNDYCANCSGLELYKVVAVPEPTMLVSLLGLLFAVLCVRGRK